MIVQVECVWCTTKNEFNRYVRLNSDASYVINYLEIINKLQKADPFNAEPSDKVVGVHIRGLLADFFAKLEDNKCKSHVLYLIKNLSPEVAAGLKQTVGQMTDHEYEINLTIINRIDYPKKGVLSKFDNVKFIEK